MNKKGVELSMNVIIIAAIGLLVLVVLSIIFLGRAGVLGQKTQDCEVQGGLCGEKCGEPGTPTAEHAQRNPLLTCPQGQVCCLKIPL